jgi:hypothetical protein
MMWDILAKIRLEMSSIRSDTLIEETDVFFICLNIEKI